jgi:hypothetical protein
LSLASFSSLALAQSSGRGNGLPFEGTGIKLFNINRERWKRGGIPEPFYKKLFPES